MELSKKFYSLGVFLFSLVVLSGVSMAYTNWDNPAYISQFCTNSKYGAVPSWASSGGIPVRLPSYSTWNKDGNLYMPCGRYYCDGRNIAIKQDKRTWGTQNGSIYLPSNGNPKIVDMQNSTFSQKCYYGCIEKGNEVRCRDRDEELLDFTKGYYVYDVGEKKYSIDFSGILGSPVSCSINNSVLADMDWCSIEWSDNGGDGHCNQMYYCYAVLSLQDKSTNDAIKKKCVELPTVVPGENPCVARITMEPFTYQYGLYNPYFVKTFILVREANRDANRKWSFNDWIPEEYVHTDTIAGIYTPLQQDRTEQGIWDSIRYNLFSFLW